NSVACPTEAFCLIVGVTLQLTSRRPVSQPVSYIWQGGRWLAKPMREVHHTQATEPYAVSCASPKDCVAVGSYSVERAAARKLRVSDDTPVAELWDGRVWSLSKTPSPAGAVS